MDLINAIELHKAVSETITRLRVTLDDEVVKVDVTEAGEYFSLYQNATLNASATADILTYTVPANKILELKFTSASGENRGRFKVYSNGNVVGNKRTYFTNYNVDFPINTAKVSAGQVVKVEATNNGNVSAEFDAIIQGRLLDE